MVKRRIEDDDDESSKRMRSEELESNDAESNDASDQEMSDIDDSNEDNASGAGSIESVELTNFMCHKFLKVKLGENINFITGRNGSGKSAVLTALTVCLGGKSSFTNRASSISKLLKEGEAAGEVIVRIRNHGPDAYKPEVYGDIITIERKLVREGTSGYKVKSSLNNKTISTRKDEITNICDHLNIEVDNPMTILTQDTARMFLANSSSKEKYQFFLKGTQLEKLNQDYEALDEKVETIDHAIRRKLHVMPDIKKQVQELEKQWLDMEKVKELEQRVNQLQGEKIWCKVAEIERRRDDEREYVEDLVSTIQERRNYLEGIKETIENGNNNVGILSARMKESSAILGPLQTQLHEVQTQLRVDSQNVAELEAQVTIVSKDVRRSDESIAEFENRYQRELHKLNSMNQSQANDRGHQIKVLEGQMQSEEQKKRDSSDKIQEIENDTERVTNALRDLEPHMERKRAEIGRVTNQINALRNKTSDELSAFGRNVPQVLREIEQMERDRRWRGAKPIGPLGRYVKVTDHRFTNVIESCLDKSLNSFSVDNHEDSRLLRGILSRYQNQESIYIYKPQRELDITQGRPASNLKTVYDVLRIEHPIVKAQLIINNQIEKIVLVSSHEEGDSLTSGSWPRNVQYVYSDDCYEFGNKQGGLQTRSLNRYRGMPRLAADANQLLKQQQSILRDHEDEFEDIKREYEEFKKQKEAMESDKRYYYQQARNATHRLGEIQRKIESVKESMQNDDTSQVTAISDALEEEKKRRETLEQQKRDASLALSQAKVLLNERKAQQDEIKARLRSENHGMEEQRKEAEQIQMNIRKATLALDASKKKLEKDETEYATKFEGLKKTEKLLREQIVKCSQFCERVPVSRTEPEIDQELVRLNALVKRKEELYGSREAFYQKLVKKRAIYSAAKKDVDDFQKLITYINEIKRNRSKRYQQFKKFISIRAMRMFSELIQKRGYRGVLELDHETQSLGLKVDINAGGSIENHDHVDIDSDPKSLSGGEKSYATVCLLLALWESMASPFRALDEFDVFMDAANRHLAMKLMVDHARTSHHNSQYILISPQGASQTDLAGPDIRILKMREPERGQTTINFAPAAR